MDFVCIIARSLRFVYIKDPYILLKDTTSQCLHTHANLGKISTLIFIVFIILWCLQAKYRFYCEILWIGIFFWISIYKAKYFDTWAAIILISYGSFHFIIRIFIYTLQCVCFFLYKTKRHGDAPRESNTFEICVVRSTYDTTTTQQHKQQVVICHFDRFWLFSYFNGF